MSKQALLLALQLQVEHLKLALAEKVIDIANLQCCLGVEETHGHGFVVEQNPPVVRDDNKQRDRIVFSSEQALIFSLFLRVQSLKFSLEEKDLEITKLQPLFIVRIRRLYPHLDDEDYCSTLPVYDTDRGEIVIPWGDDVVRGYPCGLSRDRIFLNKLADVVSFGTVTWKLERSPGKWKLMAVSPSNTTVLCWTINVALYVRGWHRRILGPVTVIPPFMTSQLELCDWLTLDVQTRRGVWPQNKCPAFSFGKVDLEGGVRNRNRQPHPKEVMMRAAKAWGATIIDK